MTYDIFNRAMTIFFVKRLRSSTTLIHKRVDHHITFGHSSMTGALRPSHALESPRRAVGEMTLRV